MCLLTSPSILCIQLSSVVVTLFFVYHASLCAQGWVTGGGQWQPMQQAGQPGGYVYQPQFTSQAQQFQGPGQQYPGHVQQFQTQPVYGGSVPSSNAGQGFPQQQHQFPQQQQVQLYTCIYL